MPIPVPSSELGGGEAGHAEVAQGLLLGGQADGVLLRPDGDDEVEQVLLHLHGLDVLVGQDQGHILFQIGPHTVKRQEDELMFAHLEHAQLTLHDGLEKCDDFLAEVPGGGLDDDAAVLQRLGRID